MSADPPMTPIRPTSFEPDTVPRELIFEDDNIDEMAPKTVGKRPRGRPTKRGRSEAGVDPRFRGRGALSEPAKGFVRCFWELNPDWSMRQLAERFNTSPAAIFRVLHSRLGDAAQGQKEQEASAAETDRRQKILGLLALRPFASVRQLKDLMQAQGQAVSKSTVHRDLQAVASLRARPEIPWSGGDENEWRSARLRFATCVLRSLPSHTALLFTDESQFRVKDPRTVQWCKEGQEPDPMQVHKWSAGAHVWACIGVGFRVCVALTDRGTGPNGGITSGVILPSSPLIFCPPSFLFKTVRGYTQHSVFFRN